ncbi:hypothetical protein [Metapseudomonas sp. CR1201]|jgi:hypothetical protein
MSQTPISAQYLVGLPDARITTAAINASSKLFEPGRPVQALRNASPVF